MELRHLTQFIAVAEERHFGRAAKRLHMAQPPLSQQIRQLEEQLGVRLLDRTTRRVDLTPAGQELLDRGRKVVEELEALEADVRRLGSGTTGDARLGFAGSATYDLMPAVVRRIEERLPGVGALARGELLTPTMESGLRDGSLDIAFLRPPVASPEVEFRVLRRDPLVVAVPAGSSFAAGRAPEVAELREQAFVAHPPMSVVHRALRELCRRHGFEPRTARVAQGTAEMLSFVAAGSGIAAVPASVRALRLDGVAYVDLVDAPEVELALAWRRDERSALVRSLLDVVVDLTDGGTGVAAPQRAEGVVLPGDNDVALP
ncbi:LysR family transcriptional regulator [Kocuria varians]|uniref:LysR family transcriptional regulator n=1 Tax=Kocuria varians TaxID=1272 RepID=A0A4Y4D2Y3_KOCVA|nr:LysR substrate-binding domain-containing protein [Kocuria varians]GEC98094.1 LysR family transcriptional regulator [Kocuria varians]